MLFVPVQLKSCGKVLVEGGSWVMDSLFTVLWVGNEMHSPIIEAGLSRAACREIRIKDISDGLQVLRRGDIDLVVLESPKSCVQGELLAVRLKNIAARVPILLLCDPLDKGTPQVFFVNLILGMNASPELLLKAIQTLLPSHPERKTGT
jgi:hypothetical protein